MGSNISTIQKHLKNEAKSCKTKNHCTCFTIIKNHFLIVNELSCRIIFTQCSTKHHFENTMSKDYSEYEKRVIRLPSSGI
jgi:hypothetical protein